MSLKTHSKFYYLPTDVDTTNNLLNFSEGGAELKATLNPGTYTPSELATEIARALNTTGTLGYSASFDRTTRKITIAALSNFTLKVSSGTSSAASIFALAGFTGADRSGASSYQANSPCGSQYATQFILQDYVSSEDYREAAEATVNRSASGRVEVFQFGEVHFIEMNLRLVTDMSQPAGSPIRSNATGVEELRLLMRHLTRKAPVEFMADESTPGTWEKAILESTPDDSKGTGYKLKELYGMKLPGYFETGTLKMRVVE